MKPKVEEEALIKPAADKIDEKPVGGAKAPTIIDEDVQMAEEKPLPRGTYNLDALGEDAFGGGVAPPKKGPPARLANKAKPAPNVE